MKKRLGWFGPSKKEIWRQLCEELDGDFIPGGFNRADKVQVYHRDWIFTLETHSDGNALYTRMRAPYVNWDDFKFRIFKETLLNGIDKLLYMQDVQVGHPEFDKSYVIQGNDERKLKMLFDNPHIRELIFLQPKIRMEIRHEAEAFKPKFPKGVYELNFRQSGTIKDLDQLHDLYDLFAEMMDHLCEIGTAYEDDPNSHAP